MKSKKEYLFDVIKQFLNFSSYEKFKNQFTYIYNVFEKYTLISSVLKIKTSDLITDIVVLRSTINNNQINEIYTISQNLMADIFKTLYYNQYLINHDLLNSKTNYLKECIVEILETKSKVYQEDNTYKNGFDRRCDIVLLKKDGIEFIENKLFLWYKIKKYINPIEFINYIEKKGLISELFYIFYPSVEKDKPQEIINIEKDDFQNKLSIIEQKFKSKYNQKSLSTSLSTYLTAWFNSGYHSDSLIYFCEEKTGRLKTFSKYIERKYFDRLPTYKECTKFICKNFDINNNSFSIIDDTIDSYLPKNQNDSIDLNNITQITSIIAKYYGFIRNKNADTDENATIGNEYFISDSNASIQTFCFLAMSGTSYENSQYSKFLSFIEEMYNKKNILTDSQGNQFCNYIDLVYVKIKNL